MEMSRGTSRIKGSHCSSLQGARSQSTLSETPEFKEKGFVFLTSFFIPKGKPIACSGAQHEIGLHSSPRYVCRFLIRTPAGVGNPHICERMGLLSLILLPEPDFRARDTKGWKSHVTCPRTHRKLWQRGNQYYTQPLSVGAFLSGRILGKHQYFFCAPIVLPLEFRTIDPHFLVVVHLHVIPLTSLVPGSQQMLSQ